MEQKPASRLQPDASELIVSSDPRYVCETYIFEPTDTERALGRLYAVGETESRDGIGKELLDLAIQAMQREYYREPSRGVLASFESALHQANLVLHDTAEQGVRDWMGHFHVAVGVLAGTTLHVSTAGKGEVLLTRRGRTTLISQDLSHSPITNPLRTFAQVASGTIMSRDTLFFGTANFSALFRWEDLAHFAIDHTATTIATRLKQLYDDQGASGPIAALTICVRPEQSVKPVRESSPLLGFSQRQPRTAATLAPRKPLVIHRSWLKTMLVFVMRMLATLGTYTKTKLWPAVIVGSRQGGKMVATLSQRAGQTVQQATARGVATWRPDTTTSTNPALPPTYASAPATAGANRQRRWQLPSLSSFNMTTVRTRLGSLPRSSKVFAGITLLLLVALVVSLLLLRHKRAEDATIQRASEILHDAQTKKVAAETALIYDNREQAHTLLQDASAKVQEVAAMELYQSEAQQLAAEITTLSDRLQKITRPTVESLRVIGDFASQIEDESPTMLTYLDDALYTFNPATNAMVRLGLDGTTATVTSTVEGIGFVTAAAPHAADKTWILATSTPGLALFDAKTNTLQDQAVTFSQDGTELTALATYGTRLYAYDTASQNIVSFSKSLRGYGGGTPWITAQNFPKDNIVSLGVDGSIYTLHRDGAVRKLLKGEVEEFTLEPVEPALTGATRLIKTENTRYLYIVDTTNKRVIIYTPEGKLVRQLFLDVASQLKDIALSPDETTLYALDGTRVVAVSLTTEE